MNKTLNLIMAAAAGGAVGALLMWLAVRPAAPTTLFIGFPSQAAVESDQRRGISILREAFSEAANRARANEPRPMVSSEGISDNLPPLSAELETVQHDSSGPDVVEVLNHSAATVQQVSVHATPPQLLPANPPVSERVDSSAFNALSFALEAADPYQKEGFVLRQDFWSGELAAGEAHAVLHQLFKGNEYWFWAGSDTRHTRVSVHVYDSDGRLVDAEHWQRPMMAAARVLPEQTGEYYVIVRVDKSPQVLTRWALTYGFR